MCFNLYSYYPKVLFFSLFFFFFYFSFSQQNSKGKKIECEANILKYDSDVDPDIQTLIGNVIFRHEGAICYADTAYNNEKTNVIEAFGKNLVIHINDSVHLHGKYLIYDGNTRIAQIHREVILTDESSELHTDKLTYYRNEEYAFYDTGGKIISDSSTLVSQYGWYYTDVKDAFFKKDVVVTTPDYTITSDTMKYNTETKIVNFLSPTLIFTDSGSIYCELGWHNTETDISQFQQNTKIINNSQELCADTVWYSKIEEHGIARSNVSIFDSVENVLLLGHYAEYQGLNGFAFMVDSAIAILIEKEDSLFLHADTLWAAFDTAKTLQYLSAYHHVLFYREDIQGSCDSLVYLAEDSVVLMLKSPLLWFESNQSMADTIRMYTENRQAKEMHLIKNAFICEDVFEETKFNQIKGVNAYIYFKDNQADYAFVDADAECLYYVQEEDSSLIGINQSKSVSMRINFVDNEVSTITFYQKVKGDMSPENMKKEFFLPDFIWLNQFRPKNKFDIFMPEFYQAEPKKTRDEEEEEE